MSKKTQSNFQVNGLFVWHVTFLVFDSCKVLFFPHRVHLFCVTSPLRLLRQPLVNPRQAQRTEKTSMAKLKIQGAWLQALAPENLGNMLLSKLKKKLRITSSRALSSFFWNPRNRNFPSMENVVTTYIRSFLKGSPTSRLQYWSWKLNIWMIQVSRKILRQAAAYMKHSRSKISN